MQLTLNVVQSKLPLAFKTQLCIQKIFNLFISWCLMLLLPQASVQNSLWQATWLQCYHCKLENNCFNNMLNRVLTNAIFCTAECAKGNVSPDYYLHNQSDWQNCSVNVISHLQHNTVDMRNRVNHYTYSLKKPLNWPTMLGNTEHHR